MPKRHNYLELGIVFKYYYEFQFMKWFLLFLVVIAGCTLNENTEEYSTATIIITNSDLEEFVFTVEVPLSSEGFAQGLMNRERMDSDKGMLFAYENMQPLTFWMKNTLLPLDMLFIDEKFVIRTIHHAVPCVEEPCALYESGVSVQYVLEINGNITKENNINIGDSVEIG
jgi:uncharacterized protein